jgi:protein-disulfide isomerase
MHRALLDHGASLSESVFRELAREAGLNLGAFDRCMSDLPHEAAIARDEAEATALNVKGVPATFINGERLAGAQPLEAFTAAVDRALAAR